MTIVYTQIETHTKHEWKNAREAGRETRTKEIEAISVCDAYLYHFEYGTIKANGNNADNSGHKTNATEWHPNKHTLTHTKYIFREKEKKI